MEVLQELLELEALKRLKASYFYYMDTKAWDSWLDLFTPDVVLEWDLAVGTRGGNPPAQRCVGVEEIQRRVVREYLDPSTSVHQGHTPLLELRSETEATGVWAMEDVVIGRPGHPDIHGYGHYRETYRKVDGHWKIATLHLTRLRLTSTTALT
jgi:SnoaL-like domain